MVPPAPFHFTSEDGLRIACFRWDAREGARGVVQIAHGMGEHIGRYDHAIQGLVSAGWTVYGNDHRGHGRTATSPAHLGDFGQGGFPLLVADMVELSRIAKVRHPELPLVLLGHSMGSFAAQCYVLDHSGALDGLILSGSGILDGLVEEARSAPPGKNILNAPFEPARTPFDWLSRDPAVVDAFMADPLCFAELQPAARASFFAAAPRLCDLASLRSIRSSLPVYLFSGNEDAVGQQLAGVRRLFDRYRNAGLGSISHDFYPGGRHEMLNEINWQQVLARLVGWISHISEGARHDR